MKKRYEAWEDDESLEVVFSTSDSIAQDKESGRLSKDGRTVFSIYASTWEEANFTYYEYMGWEPYVPPGELAFCPNSCGASYYPEGSAECPNCGIVEK